MKETKLEKLKIERNKIERQISDIEYKKLVEISIPELKESVGRCFKYRNSYGAGESWWLYVKILSVNEKTMSFKVVEFQQTSMDIIEIKFDQKYNFNGKNYFNGSHYTEIKLSEFEKARKGILKTVSRLLQ